MLHTQVYGANGFGGGLGSLGALMSSSAITSLQNYLKTVGRYSGTVTGAMNDATMAAVFDMLISSAATVAKIPLLPSDIRGGINTVVNALKTADSKIKSVSFGQASLSSVIRNWATINAAVRVVSSSAADAMASARESVYNAVGGYASTIERAARIFFPPTSPTTTAASTTMSPTSAMAIMTAISPGKAAAAASASATTFPAGTLYAWSKKIGKYIVAIPKTSGLGSVGIMGTFGNCIFGDCGLGATATHTLVAPMSAPPPGGTPTTETKVEAATGTLPIYKKWWFWTAIGGGVAVAGTGTALIMRRKRSV
jgi:hypothetical protein